MHAAVKETKTPSLLPFKNKGSIGGNYTNDKDKSPAMSRDLQKIGW
jgi:hypothetical protein